MKKSIAAVLYVMVLLATACIGQTTPSKADAGKTDLVSNWYTRIGVGGVIYHPAATVYADGTNIPGATAQVSNNVTLLVDAGYYVLPKLTVSLMAGIPPKPKLSGAGTISAYGELGSVWYGPAVLSAQYHFGKGKFQPYFGPGVAYAIILRKHAAALEHIQVHNAFAPVIQAGGEYMFNKHLGAFVDCKQIWLSVDAHGDIAGVVPAKAHVKLYPTVPEAGLKYRF
jgi:outer membrane protein